MFKGQLVELRPISKDHLATYLRWFQDPELPALTWLGPAAPVTREQEEAWYSSANQPGKAYTFGIHTLGDDRLIGNCGLQQLDAKNRSAVLGIAIGEREYWGRGYGSDAIRALLEFGFAELNLHRVELRVFSFNERACRSYLKVGFMEEGRRRDALFRHGRYWDDVIMSMLEHEFRARAAAPREG